MSVKYPGDKTPLASGEIHFPGELAEEFRIPLERALRQGLAGTEIPLPEIEDVPEGWDQILDALDETLLPYGGEDLRQKVLDALPLRIFWKDPQSHYLGGNRRFLREAGLASSSDLAGLSDFDLPWKEQAEKCRDEDFRIMREGLERLEAEEMRQSSRGERHWFRKVKQCARDGEGRILGVIGYCQDITGDKAEAGKASVGCESGSEANPRAELGRILLAGGSPFFRESVRKIALGAGYQVEFAGNYSSTQSSLRFGLFDLVLADGDDSQLDILELCREMKSQPGAELLPPFLVFSARPAVDVAVLCREAGICELLAKPPDKILLQRALSRWLRDAERPLAG